MNNNLQYIADEALEYGKAFLGKGVVADYIPELAKGNPGKLGVCICDSLGNKYKAGNTEDRFTIQSISKVVSLLVALETAGYEDVFSYVGMEPTGDAFNSLVKLETNQSKPLNPMINAGAIVVTGRICDENPFDAILKMTRRLCGSELPALNEEVYLSEKEAGNRNRAMAYFLKGEGLIEGNVEEVLDHYFRSCSINVSASELAHFAMILANNGKNPVTGERIVSGWNAHVAKALMTTCGMYDGSGEFAVKVGMPSKSGVGGGIMSVGGDGLGIGVFSPGLDKKGNSYAGRHCLEFISKELYLNLFQ